MPDSIDEFYQELKEKADEELMKLFGRCVIKGPSDQEYFKIAAINTLLQERNIEPSTMKIAMSFKMPDGKDVVVPIGNI